MIGGILFAMLTLVPQDTGVARLPAVDVRVAREPGRPALELPYAVTRLVPDSLRPGLRNATIDERLFLIPGVFVANRNNPTQDPRISVRGFGSRSAFGVRGVRVLMDGVPLTLPDGQTPLDYLDLESIGSLELIRGSASSLYGNAAGGVLDIRSRAAPDAPFDVLASGWGATHSQRKGAVSAGGRSGDSFYALSVSQMQSDGFRDHSRQRITNGSLRAGTELGGARVAAGLLAHDMPLAQNPGALTRSEMLADPSNAEPLAVAKRARKEVNQVQGGLTLAVGSGSSGELELVVHGGTRDLYNPLQFAIVNVDRTSHGASLRGTKELMLLDRRARVTAGVDYQKQNDERTEYNNCNFDPPLEAPTAACPELGVERGTLRRDQKELVSGIGPFVRGEMEVLDRLWLNAGVRSDRIKFEVRDEFISLPNNPDDSGERILSEVSPMVGLLYRTGALTSVYATYSTAFETPTATELGNKPDGSAGFNPDLEPQRSWTIEVGSRGWLRTWWTSGLTYDVAVYTTSVDDELIPFEIAGGAGRRFFRNAGSTSRTGFEASLGTGFGPAELVASYTYSHFLFDDYDVAGTSFDDNRIPGIPIQQLQGSATFRRGAWYLTVEGEARGGAFVDDANTASTRAPGYELMHLRLGGEGVAGLSWFSPRVGVQNLFDRTYAASVSVNAAGGRYFEPAPGRVIYAGVTIGGIR